MSTITCKQPVEMMLIDICYIQKCAKIQLNSNNYKDKQTIRPFS